MRGQQMLQAAHSVSVEGEDAVGRQRRAGGLVTREQSLPASRSPAREQSWALVMPQMESKGGKALQRVGILRIRKARCC